MKTKREIHAERKKQPKSIPPFRLGFDHFTHSHCDGADPCINRRKKRAGES